MDKRAGNWNERNGQRLTKFRARYGIYYDTLGVNRSPAIQTGFTEQQAANAVTIWSRHRGAGLWPATSAFEPTFFGFENRRDVQRNKDL